MSRVFASLIPRLILLSFLAILAVSAPSQADTTYYFTATPITGVSDQVVSGFTLQYIDKDTNARFSVSEDELVPGTFSGVTFYSTLDIYYAGFFTGIVVVPPYDADLSPFTDSTESPTIWLFNRPGVDIGISGAYAEDFTYTQSAVPLPSSALMLVSGLIGLAGWRRFSKG